MIVLPSRDMDFSTVLESAMMDISLEKMKSASHAGVDYYSLIASKWWPDGSCFGRRKGGLEGRSGTEIVPEKHSAVNNWDSSPLIDWNPTICT